MRGNSTSNHLGAQGTFNPTWYNRIVNPRTSLSRATVTGLEAKTGVDATVTSEFGTGFGAGDAPVQWGTFLSVILWNTSGYDSVGALAAEVRRKICRYVDICR